MRYLMSRLTRRAHLPGRHRGAWQPMIRTCPHGLVVCVCSPPPPAAADPWLLQSETIAFDPRQVRRG